MFLSWQCRERDSGCLLEGSKHWVLGNMSMPRNVLVRLQLESTKDILYFYTISVFYYWFVFQRTQTFCFPQHFVNESFISFCKGSSSSSYSGFICLWAFVEWLEPNCGAMYLITLSWGPLITSPLTVKSVYYRRLTAWTASIIFRFHISHSTFTHTHKHTPLNA